LSDVFKSEYDFISQRSLHAQCVTERLPLDLYLLADPRLAVLHLALRPLLRHPQSS
jgi:hypothetical protein